jgi:endonuclease/exonuclease/phosphatase family metal-dependent hydrolase
MRRQWQLALFVVLLLLGLAAWGTLRERTTTLPRDNEPASTAPVATGSYLFCFWNVENLFDDQQNPVLDGIDQELDRWFATDLSALQLKLGRLAEALLRLNGGHGPDILALVEVENYRAADLLRQALNARLADASRHYQHVLIKDTEGLRHISPGILTRLPVDTAQTRVHGRRQRILEGRVVLQGRELVIVACHWTSRIADKDGDARARYADQIYQVYQSQWRRQPEVDLLVCGDFNDSPEDNSVRKHLHATGDRAAVIQPQGKPLLLNLLADRDPDRYGTHYHQRLLIFDQIAVSPGMLDSSGWSCDPGSVRVVNSLRRPNDRRNRPWSFGGKARQSPRGYSDHFPVTVELRFHSGGPESR